MDYYAIAPINHLDLIKDEKHHMVITPFVMDKKIMKFYQEQKETGAKIMLDNGEFEDVALTLDEYISIIETLEPDVICLPDVWKNAGGTISEHMNALEKLKEVGLRPKCMIIPHGIDMLNYLHCTAHIVNNVIPKYLEDGYEFILGLTFAEWGDTSGIVRPFLSRHLMTFAGEFHFLGLYNTRELWTCDDKVTSVDSSFPFKAALQNYELWKNTRDTIITDKFDFHAELNEHQIKLARTNLNIMHYLVEEKSKENPFEPLR